MAPQYFILIIAALLIYGIVTMIIFKKKNREAKDNYLSLYPNSCKVFLKSSFIGVASSNIEVRSIDGVKAAFADHESIYVKPGKSVLEVRFTSHRKGVVFKNVHAATDFIPFEVDLQEGKEYTLSFDKNNGFQIAERK
ncbi:hypothetical protein DWQ65_08370 [Treponema phagedenis]|uniref:hypothetical protein n=1 Tax=Treponema phagedenis TaxID=162 RepID=UPI0001F63F58|nr:hypothetical protein [Treponema phagedenis]EFW37346.1 hypothetical protein HMPREF9554_02178 [Treponema phagedenis F0421]QEJ96040.1 DUF2057 domain-containing protein [Treponema phagedenis]QSI00075.1 hypothetical protein DWQ65_08370 [Treponema phagedenis]TYT79140.1 DUF2057 domain-containing protein [Treponema phagedenis]